MEASATTARKRVVARYIDGFRAGDHEAILACLTDDVTWVMPPYFELSGSGTSKALCSPGRRRAPRTRP